MKRLLLSIIAVIFAATGNTFAGNVGIGTDWTPVQLSFMPGVQNCPSKNNVDGVKFGLPWSVMDGGMNQKVSGLELGFVSMSRNVTGAQLSLSNLDTSNCSGFQLAGANVSNEFKGAQIGGFNELDKGGGSQLGLVNIGQENKGVAAGVINYHEINSSGLQIGAINSAQNYNGVQFGAFNFNDDEDVYQTGRNKSSLLQFGAINYMENGFLPVFILFNFRM